MPPSTDLNITIISAGAGSGKTYTLTQRMVALMQSGVRARGIMATTFTQKPPPNSRNACAPACWNPA
ncbi:MAG: UvrD-helicase domain-containing protein [Lewinellaceae bacterium]|nr:UvrD-helicase domain-containing protein [Lewinellaceae bacterium]